MYLDADGDGVHTAADVVPSSGSVTFDVWLKTDENRDGSHPVCSRNSAAPFTINSYTFLLRARNGTVTWSNFVNRMPNLTLVIRPDSSATEYFAGRADALILPPGTYKLASLTATIALGTPTISIVPTPTSVTAIAMTSFGCQCEGLDWDNTMKLGSDWFDVDGLDYDGVSNHGPVLDPVAGMSAWEGSAAEQTLRASDADGEPLRFSKISGPSFLTVTTTDPGSGTATGIARLEPGYTDAGNTGAMVAVDDGVSYDTRPFGITVYDVNRPPVLAPVSDMTVAPGDTTDQTITAVDPEGEAVRFAIRSGPTFLTILPSDPGSAILRVTPPSNLGGLYTAVIQALDSFGADEDSVTIDVTGPRHPPVIDEILPSVEVQEEGFNYISIYATDVDGAETLSFLKVSGPAFMEVRTWGVSPGYATYAQGAVYLSPHAGDRGDYVAVVGVTDGTSTSTGFLSIRVTNGYPGDTSVLLSGERGCPLLDGESFRLTGWRTGVERSSSDSLRFWFFASDSAGDIELAPRGNNRNWFDCSNGLQGSVTLAGTGGAALGVGIYDGAILISDGSSPGLDARIGCARCASASGRFEVKELDTLPGGGVRSAWVTFEVRCDGSSAALRGDLRFHARKPPVTVYAPTHARIGVDDDASFFVTAADSGARPVSLHGELPANASLVPAAGPGGWELRWHPTLAQIGKWRLSFRATNPQGDTANAFTNVTILPRNAVTAVVQERGLQLFTSNRGAFACDLRDSSGGLLMPGNFGERSLADAAGLWLGAKVDGEPRVAIGGLDPEFVPGPAPGGVALPFDPRYKNYKLERGVFGTSDRRNWPGELGAPMDSAGMPEDVGDVTVWSVYNDGSPSTHASPSGGTAPLGVEVQQTTWAFQRSELGRVAYLRFLVRNTGSHRLRDAYASIWLRPSATRDVDYPSRTVPFQDVVGCDSSRSLGFSYASADPFPTPLYITPSVGIQLLKGAVQRNGTGDSVQLGMSSFRRLPAGSPIGATAAYNVMRGLRENGSPVLDPGGTPVGQEVAGDPVSGTGWLDDPTAAAPQKLLVLSTGPFDMDPGETQTIEAAFVIGLGPDRLASITELRRTADLIRSGSMSNSAPRLYVPPYELRVDEGKRLQFDVSAYDAEGDRVAIMSPSLPSGASLTVDGPYAQFAWTPGFDQAGRYDVAFLASDFSSTDTASVEIQVQNVDAAPVARSGGPYHGVAGTPVQFDGSASDDPDGNPVQLTWSFGDGEVGYGGHVMHVYDDPGTYSVLLLAYDGSLEDADTTTAQVAIPIQVHAFVGGGSGVIRLASPEPVLKLSVEAEGGATITDLQPASFFLESHGSGPVSSIQAIDSDTRMGGDSNGNGQDELSVAFRKQDLRALFQALPDGRTSITAVLVGVVEKNTAFAASVELTVETTHEPLAVVVAPNPINPRGTLTFVTTRPGHVRVSLFDVSGRLVRRLYESGAAPAGYHDVPIDGKDDRGRSLASGLYFYRIEGIEGVTSGRLTILK